MSDQADLELVRYVQANPLQFPLFHDRYWPVVKRFLYYQLGSLEEAEDVAQQVMWELARSLPRFSSERERVSVTGWVMTIALSRKIDRKRACGRSDHQAIPEDPPWPSNELSPEAAAEFAETHEWIYRMLSRLPRDQRDVMELRAIEMPTSEIANILKITEANVRKLTERARNRLRPLLAAELGGDDA